MTEDGTAHCAQLKFVSVNLIKNSKVNNFRLI